VVSYSLVEKRGFAPCIFEKLRCDAGEKRLRNSGALIYIHICTYMHTYIYKHTMGPFLGVKRSEREVYHLRPFSAEVKNVWSYISILHMVSRHGAQLTLSCSDNTTTTQDAENEE
jgi:hypothetical protein